MKTIIITGGATGIGRAIVENLAKSGYNILLGYNKSEKEAKEIKEKLISEGKTIEIFKVDILEKKQISEMIKFTLEKFGSIDVLINNAGISKIKMFCDTTDQDWEEMININLRSAFYTIREVLPYMVAKKEGLIINISSIWGLVGSSCEVIYSVSKAGLDGMTKALAKELGPSNIRVNSIAPRSN